MSNNHKVAAAKAQPVETKKTSRGDAMIYTYVGAGAGSPQIINFMGKQKFIRGKATEVTDPEVLSKIQGVPTFMEGEVDVETLHRIDQEGVSAEEAQKEQDKITNTRYTKKHHGE